MTMKIGYARVSTKAQNLDRQIGSFCAEKCDEIFREKASAKSLTGRPQLEKAIDALGTDDVFVIAEWDRATRSMTDGIADGKTTRMGVTSEHPLFAVGSGWTASSDLAAGDVIRDSELREIRVLSVQLDTSPQVVHNLEVANAHTYFAGELEAWGHNGLGAYVIELTTGIYVGKGCPKRMKTSLKEKIKKYGGDVVSFAHYDGPTTDDESFILEHELMCNLGFEGKDTPGMFNQKFSPGKNK